MNAKKFLKNVVLKSLTAFPIVSIAFAAQSALAIADYDGISQNSKFKGKSLFINGVEYNLQKALNTTPTHEHIDDISIGFIQNHTSEIVNGEVEGVEIDDSIMMTIESGSISGWR